MIFEVGVAIYLRRFQVPKVSGVISSETFASQLGRNCGFQKHRGQLTVRLVAAGFTPPADDFIAWKRAQPSNQFIL